MHYRAGDRLIRTNRHVATTCLLLIAASIIVFAQDPHRPSATSPLAAALSAGWSALSRGDVDKAREAAERALAAAPANAAAVSLAVEIEVARGGALPGLDVYERWLRDRKVDAPYVLRRIALAHLRWTAQQPHGPRLEALRALVAEGDEEAAAELQKGAAAGGAAQARVLATMGDPRGVEMLIGHLQVPGGGKASIIDALGESRSRLAVAPLIGLLSDIREDHRAAAATALGRLGATEAIPPLKSLLKDPVVPVRTAAAAALYRLEDYSGIDLLDQLLASDHSMVRLNAAEAMAARPTAAWMGVVRALADDPDTSVQLGAARLLAPYDQQLASAILQRLRSAENPAIREEAGRAFVEQLAADFASLRRYLRTDAITAVRAASRILELTR